MRNFGLMVISLLMIFSPISISGQKAKQTSKTNAKNAKTIYATDFVDQDGWTKYISTEGKFNVLLPAEPQRTLKAIDSPYGKKNLVTYTSTYNTLVFVVGFLDFKVPINDEASLRLIYDGWQKGIFSVYPKAEIEEKDTTFDNKLAREITCVSGLTSLRAKAFFARGKLFQLMTMNVIEGGEALLSEVSVNDDKFFNSLIIDSLASETNKINLAGEIKDGFYQNNYFNFTVSLPKNWIFVEREDTELIKEGAKTRADQKSDKTLETSLKRTLFLFSLTRNEIGSTDNASIIGAAETAPSIKATIAQIANATALNFVQNMGYTQVGTIKYPKIDSVTFAAIHLKKKGQFGQVFYQKLYIARVKGYLLEFVLSYVNEEDLNIFENSIKSINFIKTK